MNIQTDYRYPGSRPFQDTPLDRRIFFGREHEKQALFHKVLIKDLVVLFAKSGMGKTSLLNAGVIPLLKQEHFIPLIIRFNTPGTDCSQMLYDRIDDTVKQIGKDDPEQKEVEYKAGERKTLWEYFKTVQFRSSDDILLTPLLNFDQFEEFFTLYSLESRKPFITQLADLVRGRIPKKLRESLKPGEQLSYTDTPPNVKIIISIREDRLAHLEELSREIPDILHNRFRLLPLNREQASQAIEKPAELPVDDQITSRAFRYAPETREEMLNFLCTRKERGEEILTDEVDPVQLQLLCHHIETLMQGKPEKEVVEKEVLRGKTGMQSILTDFYDNQVNQLQLEKNGKKVRRLKQSVRRLFEKGLISDDDQRLSLEEKYIERYFKVPERILKALVDYRLLRAEPRVGSVYYELSHDTLVVPIRSSQKKRHQVKSNRILKGGFLIGVIIIMLSLSITIYLIKDSIIEFYQQRTFAQAMTFYKQGNYDKAIEKFNKALLLNPESPIRADIYRYLGLAFYKLAFYKQEKEKYNDASKYLKQAAELDPNSAVLQYELGVSLYHQQGELDEAMNSFKKAAVLAPEFPKVYYALGRTYQKQEKYEEAMTYYFKAFLLTPGSTKYLKALTDMFSKQARFKLTMQSLKNLRNEGIPDEILEDLEFLEYQEFTKKNEFLNAVEKRIGEDQTVRYKELILKHAGLESYGLESYLTEIHLEPDNANAYNRLGVAFNHRKMFELAIDAFKESIRLNPDYKYTYNNLGFALIAKGSYNEAIQQLQQAIQIDPEYADAYNNWGRALYHQGKYAEAIEQYQKAIQDDPGNVYLYNNLGYALFNQGRYDEAIDQFEKAIDLDPNFANAYNGLGQSLAKQGREEGAIEQYQQAIQIDPEYANAYYNLGMVFSEQNRDIEAIGAFSKTIQFNPQHVEAYNNLGKVLSKQGRYQEAIQNFQIAINLNSQYAEAHYHLGEVFNKQGKYNEAIQSFQTAIQLNPQYTEAYYHLGQAFTHQGKYEEAIETFTKIIQLIPMDAEAYYYLGIVFNQQGRYEEAMTYLLMASRLDPQNVTYRDALKEHRSQQNQYAQPYYTSDNPSVYLDLAKTLISQGKYEEAIDPLNVAIQLNPEYTEVYYYLGIAFNQQQKYEEAIETFIKTIQLNPQYTGAYYHLSEIFIKLGRNEEAAKVYYDLGYIFYQQNRYNEAITPFLQAFQLIPWNSDYYVALMNGISKQSKYAEGIRRDIETIHFDPNNAMAYYNLAIVLFEQREYSLAYNFSLKVYKLAPENPLIKMTFAEFALTAEHFDTAFKLANEILKERTLSTSHQLAMRFVSIASLLFQGKRSEAFKELKAFIEYYRSLPGDYERSWNYAVAKQFISNTDKLLESDQNLLLKLIEFLESPKSEAGQKLKELSSYLPKYYYLKRAHSNKCLHIFGNSLENGANGLLWDCQRQDNFQFEAISADDGYFFLRAKHSGKCLQVHEGSIENGGNVIQWECRNLPQFKWKLYDGNGYYIINQNSQKCLQVYENSLENGANIIQWDCDDPSIAQWQFVLEK